MLWILVYCTLCCRPHRTEQASRTLDVALIMLEKGWARVELGCKAACRVSRNGGDKLYDSCQCDTLYQLSISWTKSICPVSQNLGLIYKFFWQLIYSLFFMNLYHSTWWFEFCFSVFNIYSYINFFLQYFAIHNPVTKKKQQQERKTLNYNTSLVCLYLCNVVMDASQCHHAKRVQGHLESLDPFRCGAIHSPIGHEEHQIHYRCIGKREKQEKTCCQVVK